MILTRISVAHPVFATMMMAAIVVIGLFSYGRLGLDQFPDVDLPVVVVATTYSGASPETVESEITRPVEQAVNTIGGVDRVTSQSFEGRSLVIVEFTLDTDSRTAAQEVRDRVSRLEAGFADGIDTPQVTRFNPDDQPILSLAVSSATKTLPELTTLADQVITRRLNTVPGVGQTAIVGGAERQIQVLLNPERMEAFGVAPATVMDAIRRENQDIAAGTLTAGITGRNVTVEGRITDAAGFERIIVKSDEGAPIRLADVATVREAGAELTSRAAFCGVPALGVDVVKVQDTNTVAVARALRAEIEKLKVELAGQGVELAVSRDNSRSIAAQVADVQRTLIEGALLTVAIVFLFLNSWRSTVITGLTLPISVIGTFAVIHLLGFTLNTMTLLALSLAIGILIDDAIVVRENITRHLHMGKSHRQAAIDGTEEIGLAVLATTLSIVAVFLPVAFMGGIIGRFFLEFGVTVAVAVLISLFVSFTLDPMLSSVWYDPASQPDARRGPLGRLVARFDRGFERTAARYASVIRWTFRHRILTLGAILLTFGISLALVPRIGAEFVPAGDRGEFTVSIETPEGSSLDYTARKVSQVERILAGVPEIATYYSTVNAAASRGFNSATVAVTLKPITERTRATMDLAEPLRERVSRIAGLTVSVNQPSLGGGGGGGASAKPLQVSVLGEGEAELTRLSDEIMARLRAIPGAVEVESSLDDQQPTLAVRVRQEAASDLGVSLQAIGDTLRPLVAGDAISVWNAPDGETYDVLVRLPEAGRERAAQLGELRVASSRQDASGRPILVSLDQVADVVDSVAPSSINRRDLSREVRISANVEGRALGEVVADLQREIAGLTLAPGYRVSFGGEAEDMAESFGYAIQALGLAVIFIYLILASQFGSFLQPLAIMTSLPLSLIGVLLGLLATGSTLNMFSIIGFIMLMGLVTKNAILLVDYSNQARARGLSLRDSLAEAGQVRLRPIVMTTLAMIFGMLPLALGLGEGGEQRAPMAHAVIGGLLSSTVLTLIFVPVALTYLDGLARRLRPFLPRSADEAHSGEAAHPAE
ncbi:efflux RND transporter permease subunit [Aureimonas phyllosphaerae]|uniref:HAE1 family hydrophobic/amphiphilic exporter-1 n=1 Tax=Aureimonas phyllosphaerae TaxID=1166078 RepID=A0A7W6BPI7_9HYPH|nr:efflux RND transporter permease subunit [Aureimonas phyllosphaerae]MBB3935678.1 HAE1 family hydrophobic/amphiphilic exporter-1 [Aureimonas phyllosphaerae]MBB3959686.1 HAE1 family hydrophobic/amphiphilic exporter-1 [Aureimonas phyllosphaerae]SFF13768.1 nodulation-related efflux transporter NolG [Aureimonas phyllosphaerae]